MNLAESIRVSWANLRANKVRSTFSILGIVIGVGSVIVVVAIVNGTRQATLEEMKAGKTNLLILRPKYSETSGRFGKLTVEDAETLKKVAHVQSAWPELTNQITVKGSISRTSAVLYGIDKSYTDVYSYQLMGGRFFSENESQTRPRICLITNKLARTIFGFSYPVGQRLRVEGVSLDVVGLIKDEERFRRIGQNGDVFVPTLTFMRVVKEPQIYSIQIRSEPGHLDNVKKSIEDVLQLGSQKGGLVELEDPRASFKEVEKWGRSWMMQMALIAGISLLVGGVGLMNVMLTTVVERTHEIGLRKALGASSKVILHQFVVESIALSGIGGLSGVLLGTLFSYGIGILSKGKILVEVLPLSIFVSFFFSLMVGLLFGLFPASKAAHLSPVEALRYE